MSQISFSIVIPHKNAPDLLQYCLDSIPTREDTQVIVIDDNSDPTVVDFNNFPQWKGVHYEVHKVKEGKGAGNARNIGIRHVTGSWIVFLDADDFLLPPINELMDEAKQSTADIIFFRPDSVKLADRKEKSCRASFYNRIISEYLATNKTDALRVQFLTPWCKLIKTELIRKHDILFGYAPYAEDCVFAARIGCAAKEIAVKDLCCYVLTEHDNSNTSNFCKSKEETICRATEFLKVINIANAHNYDIDLDGAFFFIRKLYDCDRTLYYEYIRTLHHTNKIPMRTLLNKSFVLYSRWERWKRYANVIIHIVYSN